MVRRLNKALALVRDALALVFSVVIIGTSWGKWDQEPVFLVLDSLGAVFIVLSVVDVVLLLRKVKGRAFYYGNAIYQFVPSFLIAALLPPVGVPMVVLNAAVLATLGVKKTPEELLVRPPVPTTRNYRIVVVVGLLVMLVSMFLPWVSATGTTASLFGVYVGVITHTTLPGLDVSQVGAVVALLALVLSPVSLVCGALGMVRRRFSLASGVLAIIAGGGLAATIQGSAEFGEYVLAVGGVLVFASYFTFKRA